MSKKKTVGEINCQYMDFKKVNECFGWEPKNSLKAGLNKTIEWYKKYLEQI